MLSVDPRSRRGVDDVDAYYETYVKVLESVNHPEAFISMLHRDLTLYAGATDHLWRRVGYCDYVEFVRLAYESGVRSELLYSGLVGDRMLVVSRVHIPLAMTSEPHGPVDGQTMWRVMTLRGRCIIHIRDCVDVKGAVAVLLER
jgi:hypothetical protein